MLTVSVCSEATDGQLSRITEMIECPENINQADLNVCSSAPPPSACTAANPHAVGATEHRRGPVPRLHSKLYEAAVPLCGPVSQLGRGSSGLRQRHTGLKLTHSTFLYL